MHVTSLSLENLGKLQEHLRDVVAVPQGGESIQGGSDGELQISMRKSNLVDQGECILQDWADTEGDG